MKISCDIIRDVLPLVAEDLASEETKKMVNDHIENCQECNKEFEELKVAKTDSENKKEFESIPLKIIKRKLKKMNVYIAIVTALIVTLVLMIGLNIITKPIPLSFQESVESVEIEDEKILIKFKPEVSNYNIVSNNYGEMDDQIIDYQIMSWKTLFSNFMKEGEAKSVVVNMNEEKTTLVHYISQTWELDELIYGEEQDYCLTLPRLTMNYYLFIMVIIFVISGLLFLVLRRKNKIKTIIQIIMMFTVSYILSHICIVGISGMTHHILRDLSFVLITTILMFGIFMMIVFKNKIVNKDRKPL